MDVDPALEAVVGRVRLVLGVRLLLVKLLALALAGLLSHGDTNPENHPSDAAVVRERLALGGRAGKDIEGRLGSAFRHGVHERIGVE